MAHILPGKGVTITLSLALVTMVSTGRLAANPTRSEESGKRIVATGRDPFNRTQAETTEGFVTLLNNNPALRQRYARHFGVPQEEVVDFVRRALVPYTLPEARTMTTFGVTKSGHIYPVKDHLKKGTKVWATREGTPVLKWSCSNPLSYNLPGRRLSPPLQTVDIPSRVEPLGTSSYPILPETTPDNGLSQINIDCILVAPELPADSLAINLPDVNSATSPVLPGADEIVDAGVDHLKDIWPALLVPVFVGISSGGGGGTTPPPPPTDVPETNTIGLLAIGLPFIAALLFPSVRKDIPRILRSCYSVYR